MLIDTRKRNLKTMIKTNLLHILLALVAVGVAIIIARSPIFSFQKPLKANFIQLDLFMLLRLFLSSSLKFINK